MIRTRSLFAILLLPVVSFAAEPVHLAGREAEAIHLATKVFKSKQGYKDQESHPVYGDLKHHDVEVERHGRKLEVVFVPKWAPTEKPHRGGSTDYESCQITVQTEIRTCKMPLLRSLFSS